MDGNVALIILEVSVLCIVIIVFNILTGGIYKS